MLCFALTSGVVLIPFDLGLCRSHSASGYSVQNQFPADTNSHSLAIRKSSAFWRHAILEYGYWMHMSYIQCHKCGR
ncbi:hypothetical protein F5879DRAFT_947643 [Lentinula edodes]|nr:hypothetical protein F5879DRAFT_947643 [Lentinula edodes]